MRILRNLWRHAFDVREGEYSRTLLLGLYFVFIMVANNILKPVSWGLFLNRFDVSRLPYLYILVAVVGGLLAYLYTKIVVVASLEAAVAAATGLCVVCLLLFWALIDVGSTALLYVFSVFVSLVGIVFLAQGWLIAGTFFDSREAKRLYGLLGLGAIAGAACGSSFTAYAAARVGTKNLLPIAAVFIVLAFLSLGAATLMAKKRGKSREVRPDEERPQTRFRFSDLAVALARYRHLLVIVGIIAITFCVEVLVEFQFNALAKRAYSGDQLTAFLGRFSAYLSVTTFILQVFFTTLVVARLGVGRTLAVSPLAVGLSSVGVILAPGLLTASLARLAEAATRYSINRTAIELLYLPLPAELKARTKAFVDVFMDRFGRGVAALLLLALTTLGMAAPRRLSLFIVALAGVWILLAARARKEYLATVRKRVESRRLNLADARVNVQDTETVRLLEQVAHGANPRQVIYALTLLYDAAGYDLAPLLSEVAGHPAAAVRAKVYELARNTGHAGLAGQALEEIRSGDPLPGELAAETVAYLLAVFPDAGELAAELIRRGDPVLAEAALQALSGSTELVRAMVNDAWLLEAARSEEAAWRALAAFAVGIRGDEGTAVLHELLEDRSSLVAAAAIRAAGALRNPAYLNVVIQRLGSSALRRAAIEALTGYGEPVCPTLGNLLADPATPLAVRRQIPRVLAAVATQRSVDALERCLAVPDAVIRTAVLKSLNRLRQQAPYLRYEQEVITRQIRNEARFYYQLYASLARFHAVQPGGKATALLARTLEDRLRQSLDRLFRLLGLRYPPGPIYAAYLAVTHRRSEEYAPALEFLDNILDQDLKTIVLPMVDGSPYLMEIGRDVFGIEAPDLESAIRHQLGLQDEWLVACAVAAAAELQLRRLRRDIAAVTERGSAEVAQVAREAMAALA
jgi:AAA family ATP:ADP antiporter